MAAARRHLEAAGKARELANALAHLAILDIVRPEGPNAATETVIERARALAPGRDEYTFVHARVLLERGEFAAARNVLAPLMTPGYPEEVRNRVKSWMGSIAQREAYQAAREKAASRGDVKPGERIVVAVEFLPY